MVFPVKDLLCGHSVPQGGQTKPNRLTQYLNIMKLYWKHFTILCQNSDGTLKLLPKLVVIDKNLENFEIFFGCKEKGYFG